MKALKLFTKDIARRLLLVHPPEPRKEDLLSNPSNSIYIGKTKFNSVPVFWDYKKLINPHIGIVGVSGSGKSYLVKTFITRASLIWRTNTIILDWTGEYNKWVKQAGGRVIDLSKEHLNLLDLAGMSPEVRATQILSALDILINLKEFPNEREEIDNALEKVYKKEKEPTLNDLFKILSKTKKGKHAARLIRRLTLQGSDFFAGGSTLKLEDLLNSGLVNIDLHSLPSDDMRSLAGLTILQFIKETMRLRKVEENKKIKLFVVLDEAWKIAKDERSDVIAIVREGRKYNFSIIIASQNPTDMHETIFSNIGTMVVMRLILKDYREYVKKSLNYSEFIDNAISKFGVGQAAIHMLFAHSKTLFNTFLLKKIDGEDPLFVYTLKGENMEIELEKDQFLNILRDFGLSEERIVAIKNMFDENDGEVDAIKIIRLLESFGYSKINIVSLLRQIGIPEKNIIELFYIYKKKRSRRGVADLVIE